MKAYMIYYESQQSKIFPYDFFLHEEPAKRLKKALNQRENDNSNKPNRVFRYKQIEVRE